MITLCIGEYCRFWLAAVLLLSGCAAGQKNMPQKNEAKEAEMVGQPSDTSGDGEHVYGYHGKRHLSGGRLLLGHWSS